MGSYDRGGYNLGVGYVDPADTSSKNLQQMKDDFYQKNYPGNSAYWSQGFIDKRFKVGDQSLYNWSGNNYNQNSYRYFFNLIKRHINMVCGYQRKNRKSTIVQPRFEEIDALADDYNTVIRWCEDRDGFQEYLSETFEGSCDTGMTLLYMYMDYTYDPINGDLMTDAVSYNNFLIDQYFRKQDLSDCNGIWRRRWVSKEEASVLIPQRKDVIEKLRPGGIKDGRFPVQAELQNVSLNNLYVYDEFHYRTTREAVMIIDPYTGESEEWETEEGENSEDELNYILSQQPWLSVKKMQVPTVKLVISIGDKIIYHGKNLLNIDEYPCVPSICYYEPDVTSYAWRCMGLIRNSRDAQFLYNMRKIIELEILQSQINSGWIFPVDAVTDVKALRQSGQGFLVPLKAGRSPDEIRRIDPPAIPQTMIELSNALAEDITKIIGVNEELLGADTDDKAGILSMLRQSAGLTTLQTIFDRLDYAQRLYGRIRMKAIRKNFSKAKIQNILGREPHEHFFSSKILKYGLAVEEGNYSTTQRQTELQQLLYFRELGIPIPNKSIMRKAFISDKKRLMEDMEEESQQQAEQQQAEAQKNEQLNNSKMMESYSKSKLYLAQEREKISQTEEKLAKITEIQATAEHKEAQADLELLRTMIELEDMDLANFRKTLEMAEALRQSNQNNAMNY